MLILTAARIPIRVRHGLRQVPGISQFATMLSRRLTEAENLETCTLRAGPAKGLRFVLRLPAEKSFWLGTFERPLAEALVRNISAGDVCWDIGAHLGYFSALMARASQAPVFCFEPLPGNRQRISRHADLNAAELQILPVALADQPGEAEFLMMPDSSMGKLSSSTFQSGRSPAEKISVPVTTIDQVIALGQAPPPTLIKIDTEGLEYKILSGGRQTLERCHPTLLLEYHGCDDDLRLLPLLESYGYDCTVIETGRPATAAAIEPGQHLLCKSEQLEGTT